MLMADVWRHWTLLLPERDSPPGLRLRRRKGSSQLNLRQLPIRLPERLSWFQGLGCYPAPRRLWSFRPRPQARLAGARGLRKKQVGADRRFP